MLINRGPYNVERLCIVERVEKDLVFKRIVEWSESELILEDGTKMEVVCSESDCCAWAEGEFKM